MLNNFFRSSNLFFYVGVGLVLCALVILPTEIRVNMGSTEWPNYEDFYVGRFLAPAIGSYGLAILVL